MPKPGDAAFGRRPEDDEASERDAVNVAIEAREDELHADILNLIAVELAKSDVRDRRRKLLERAAAIRDRGTIAAHA